MAKRKSKAAKRRLRKKSKKQKKESLPLRDPYALHAKLRTGAGKHSPSKKQSAKRNRKKAKQRLKH
jgi:hypothetical protein